MKAAGGRSRAFCSPRSRTQQRPQRPATSATSWSAWTHPAPAPCSLKRSGSFGSAHQKSVVLLGPEWFVRLFLLLIISWLYYELIMLNNIYSINNITCACCPPLIKKPCTLETYRKYYSTATKHYDKVKKTINK